MNETPTYSHHGRVIREEMRIASSPEAVYAAWTDPDVVTGWFVGAMSGRMEVGESVTWSWEDGGPGMRQEVLVADPPRRFVVRQQLRLGPSILEVEVEPDGDGSLVRLTQSGYGEGQDWDDEYEGMLSGWMIALAVLKFFAERRYGRSRREVVVLVDADYGQDEVVDLQRSEGGLAKWLTRSGAPGESVGDPVRLVLENGETLTGRVLRNTRQETVWSWDEIDGVLELKAFRSKAWGSKVGLRVSSWIDEVQELTDRVEWLHKVVSKLATTLGGG